MLFGAWYEANVLQWWDLHVAIIEPEDIDVSVICECYRLGYRIVKSHGEDGLELRACVEDENLYHVVSRSHCDPYVAFGGSRMPRQACNFET
jgi:hypothetical protein